MKLEAEGRASYLNLSGRVAAHAIEGSGLHRLRNGRPESGSTDSEGRSHVESDRICGMGGMEEMEKWSQSLGEKKKERKEFGDELLLRLEFSRFFSHLAVLQPVPSVR